MCTYNKSELLKKFRLEGGNELQKIKDKYKNYKDQTDYLNKAITRIKNKAIIKLSGENLTQEEKMNALLMITYASYVVMLEYRNEIWKYDYMTFSRRIGELWEPFCKLPFKYPVKKEVSIYSPISFQDFKKRTSDDTYKYIDNLSLQDQEKKELKNRYNEVWELVESGGIKLNLDLHVKANDQYYDIDYKSGFSSNEKGNTNRLLLVGSIYNSFAEKHNTILFVRQEEEDNNGYLKKLKKSPYWEVYCSDETYDKIKELSGFDLKDWINNNMDWENDISTEFKAHLEKNDLLKYLTW